MILPAVTVIIALYLIGITVWTNRDTKPSESLDVSYIPVISRVENEDAEEDAKININTAEADELCTLDGIGPVLAERIIKKREELGGFAKLYQLMSVDGIGEDTYSKIKDKITIE